MNFRDFIIFLVNDFIKPAIWLIMSLAVVYFLWSIAQVIIKSDEMDQREELKKRAVWGIVALFVMTSMWGLVNILVNTFRPSTQLNQIPFSPTGSSGARTQPSSSGTNIPMVNAPSSGSTNPYFQTPQQSVAPSSASNNPFFQTPQQSTTPGF